MKLKRILTLCCMLTMALGMASSASAADYSFETSANPVYYAAPTTRICMMPATTTVPATRSTTIFQKSSTA